MRHAVLADTGPLYALADTSDQHHQRACRQLEQLNKESRRVVVSFPVLAETYTLILIGLGIAMLTLGLRKYGERALSSIQMSATIARP